MLSILRYKEGCITPPNLQAITQWLVYVILRTIIIDMFVSTPIKMYIPMMGIKTIAYQVADQAGNTVSPLSCQINVNLLLLFAHNTTRCYSISLTTKKVAIAQYSGEFCFNNIKPTLFDIVWHHLTLVQHCSALVWHNLTWMLNYVALNIELCCITVTRAWRRVDTRSIDLTQVDSTELTWPPAISTMHESRCAENKVDTHVSISYLWRGRQI